MKLMNLKIKLLSKSTQMISIQKLNKMCIKVSFNYLYLNIFIVKNSNIFENNDCRNISNRNIIKNAPN